MPDCNVTSRVVLAAALILLLIEASRRELLGGDDARPAPRPPRASLPVTRPARDPEARADAEVRAAITRGGEFLFAQFKDNQIAQGLDTSPW